MRGAAGNSEGKRNSWYQPGNVLRKGSGHAAAFLGLPVLAGGGGEKRLFCSPARWRCVLWSAAQVVPGKVLGAWERGRSERNALGSF